MTRLSDSALWYLDSQWEIEKAGFFRFGPPTGWVHTPVAGELLASAEDFSGEGQ
jgi:hypothetical protein